MSIIDRRQTNKNKSVGNRQKFIERNKDRIKESVDRIADSKGITDVLEDRKVTINDIDEPNFNFDMSTGERDVILPGNKNLKNGDKIYQPPEDESESGGSDDGDGLDEFTFTLTKEEFLDLYFSDMELPNFIKENLKGSDNLKWKRTGYSKDGIPARLDLVKTLKQSLARRIATKKLCEYCRGDTELCWKCDGLGYKPSRFLDDIDLRYKHFTKQPFPIKQAHVIFLMDVSASMGEYEKEMAKKFFLLLYLFLNKCYTKINVTFISHTQTAKEVTEHEFFYSQESGGTVVSSGLKLANEIIDTRINLSETNVYIAQASDGDNWKGDDEIASELIIELLSKTQYFAYIQTEESDMRAWKKKWGATDLLITYEKIAESYKNLQARQVTDPSEVYPVLRSLFEKQ